jgi:hypothetical protein
LWHQDQNILYRCGDNVHELVGLDKV